MLHLPHRRLLAISRGLGWFSIGLGAAELIAPRFLGRLVGMRRKTGVIQAYGTREVATGIGILASRDPTPWIWGRVLGDVLDLATLAPGLTASRRVRNNVGLALGAVAAVTVLDYLCAHCLSRKEEPQRLLSDHHRTTAEEQAGMAMAEGHPS